MEYAENSSSSAIELNINTTNKRRNVVFKEKQTIIDESQLPKKRYFSQQRKKKANEMFRRNRSNEFQRYQSSGALHIK